MSMDSVQRPPALRTADSSAADLPEESKRDLRLVAIILLLHSAGYGCILIATPALITQRFEDKGYDESDAESRGVLMYGFINGGAALLQFFSNPFYGRMSDRFGRKLFFCFVTAGQFLVMLMIAIFPEHITLIIATVLRGLTDSAFTLSSSVVGDLAIDEKFGQHMGILGACVGLGMILGPILGIIATVIDEFRAPFGAGALLALINFLIIVTKFRESLGRPKPVPPHLSPVAVQKQQEELASLPAEAVKFATRSVNPFSALRMLRRNPFMTIMAVALWIHQTCAAGYVTIWYNYAERRYDWGQTEATILLFCFGIASCVAQFFMLPRLVPEDKWGEKKTNIMGYIFHIGTLVLFGLSVKGWMMYVSMVITLVGFFIVPGMRGTITKEVAPSEQGHLQGALSCAGAMANVLGPPMMAGLLYGFSSGPFHDEKTWSPGGPFLVGALLTVIALALALTGYSKYQSQRFYVKNAPFTDLTEVSVAPSPQNAAGATGANAPTTPVGRQAASAAGGVEMQPTQQQQQQEQPLVSHSAAHSDVVTWHFSN